MKHYDYESMRHVIYLLVRRPGRDCPSTRRADDLCTGDRGELQDGCDEALPVLRPSHRGDGDERSGRWV